MGFLIKGRSSVWLKDEVTEGVYVAPTSSADAIEVLESGLDFKYSRDEIERNTLSDTVELEANRLGLKQVTGTIPVEYKANSTLGSAPVEDKLYKSLMGARRQITTTTTTKTGNTSTVLQIQDADISKFNVGDIVRVNRAGLFECRPISVVTTTIGFATITFPFALDNGAPPDNVVIEKATTYYHTDTKPTFSATNYLGGEIEERVLGTRVVSAALDSWETAKVGTWNFSVEGLDLTRQVGAPAFQTNFAGNALPPVLLEACIWVNGVKVDYVSFGMNLENTKTDIMSPCSSAGKIASRITEFSAKGQIKPYMSDVNVTRFDSFNDNDDFSIFGYAHNPTGVDGEFKEIIAFWFPQVKITQMPTGDQDGTLTDDISFKAYRKNGNDTVFLGFI
jgi:ribosomal protein S17